MEPLPETVEAVTELDPSSHAPHLLASLTARAGRAKEIVPDLVGVSIGVLEEGITFTLVATKEEIAVLDAIQYAAGSPCVEGAHSDEIREFDPDSGLDEARWQLFAEATAAHTVRSTLTLPLVKEGRVQGTVNLYAASRRAFVGLHDALARIFGAWAAGAATNADLSFTTRVEAQAAPHRVRERNLVDVAIAILATELEADLAAAERRLRDAATRAGVTPAQLARAIVDARREQGPEGR